MKISYPSTQDFENFYCYQRRHFGGEVITEPSKHSQILAISQTHKLISVDRAQGNKILEKCETCFNVKKLNVFGSFFFFLSVCLLHIHSLSPLFLNL